MEKAERSRERRLRNTATRLGLILRRNPKRDSRVMDWGTYGLYSTTTYALEHGNPLTGFGLDLNDIERILKGEHS